MLSADSTGIEAVYKTYDETLRAPVSASHQVEPIKESSEVDLSTSKQFTQVLARTRRNITKLSMDIHHGHGLDQIRRDW